MDFNTKQVKEGIEQIATLLSELVVKYAKEEEHVGIGEDTWSHESGSPS